MTPRRDGGMLFHNRCHVLSLAGLCRGGIGGGVTATVYKDNPTRLMSLRQAQAFRAIGWALVLVLVLLGKSLGVVHLAWPGYLAGFAALASCLLLWLAAPHCPRWVCLSFWLVLDTMAATILVGATGFHQSPFMIWLLAPVTMAVLENVTGLVWLTTGLGLTCFLGLEAWGQSVGLVKVPWVEVFWRGPTYSWWARPAWTWPAVGCAG